MGTTSIEWTATSAPDGAVRAGFTFNPWRGCTRVSPGCERCYAETFAKRVGFTGQARPSGKPVLPVIWGAKAERVVASDDMWRQPARWNAKAFNLGLRLKVFCASMADVFEDRGDIVAPRARLFRLIEATPHLDWLLLTKRPENMLQLACEAGWHPEDGWPSNVWAGTTCEDQRRADERIPHLLAVPAAVRFVSYEPALGAVDLRRHLGPMRLVGSRESMWAERDLHWVIVGGESGPGARPFDLAWARATVEQCRASGTACFVKQLGAKPYLSAQDGDLTASYRCKDAKGGDIQEWPKDLRVREFPR